MNQLANSYVERTMIASRQDELLHASRNHGIESIPSSGPFRKTLGIALIRMGELVRGRVTAIDTAEDDREIALRLAA
jgi:hypothetical protein